MRESFPQSPESELPRSRRVLVLTRDFSLAPGQGVLIHFNESLRDQPPTVVPWIAMINCDTNGTSYSQVDDIFTLTRDLGAQAALLYSLTSEVKASSSFSTHPRRIAT